MVEGELTPKKIDDANANGSARRIPVLYIRASPVSYLSAIFVGGFFSALLLYLEFEISGFIFLFFTAVVLPVLAVTDRISFDGIRLKRVGLIPILWMKAGGTRNRLRLNAVEQVDTQALRGIRRGGKLAYRYKTTLRGNGVQMDIISGGRRYRDMVRAVLRSLDDDLLDARSLELREYLAEPRKVYREAKESDIPSPDVLECSLRSVRSRRKSADAEAEHAADDVVKASRLRTLANQLRVSGSLLQALETFRRAAVISPHDPWLLYEFARCLQAFAGSERDERLSRRAYALMRLAERRAGTDPELLARLGETYFQFGDWRRASSVFKRAIERVDENFRALRGLAEIALREGKIAHVIHNFAAAQRNAASPALRRWAKSEVDYFSRLHSDDEYMELEVSRVNLLDRLIRARGFSLVLTMIGLPVILVGILLDSAYLTNAGWVVGGVGVVSWSLLRLVQQPFAERIPLELVGDEE